MLEEYRHVYSCVGAPAETTAATILAYTLAFFLVLFSKSREGGKTHRVVAATAAEAETAATAAAAAVLAATTAVTAAVPAATAATAAISAEEAEDTKSTSEHLLYSST